jgi:predicted transcriptional regulator of viral defense system
MAIMLAQTYRRRLHVRALDQYGYITTRDAADLGIPPVEVRKIAARGGLTHIARGLFRFDDIPYTGREPFMEAVLRAGEGAVLTGDAVLSLHDLALVNPRRIRVAAPRQVRADLPPTVEVRERRVHPGDRTVYEGIPTTTVARALLDARGTVMTERLVDAAREAMRRGLLLRREGEQVIHELERA